MSARAPISAIVLTQNNASIVARCIRSLSFADDIVVVDAESVDDTACVARSLGARVVEHAWPGFAEQPLQALELAADQGVEYLTAVAIT